MDITSRPGYPRPRRVPTESSIGARLLHRALAADQSRHRLEQVEKLVKNELMLVRACEQVILLNDKIRGLSTRYQAARAENFKSFRYNIRIRLAIVEGIRNMYYEFARDRAEDVADLRKELYDQTVQIVTASDDDEDDVTSDYEDVTSDESYESYDDDASDLEDFDVDRSAGEPEVEAELLRNEEKNTEI
ncbi:hypothetical protein DPMN_086187 [Dreissena polymorpha]|uniref:Uncharacterized protein n=1 Tax=Dreissena polymorpha TaxID=45954 RepID=A0A9D3YHU9_DREPO|nr:hypothetical protein DPMN_086187 [Dreissena polymorpha]